jgi:hypothetical protein
MELHYLLPCSQQPSAVSIPRIFRRFIKSFFFYDQELLDLRSTHSLDEYTLLDVRYCLLNVYSTLFHSSGLPSPPTTWGHATSKFSGNLSKMDYFYNRFFLYHRSNTVPNTSTIFLESKLTLKIIPFLGSEAIKNNVVNGLTNFRLWLVKKTNLYWLKLTEFLWISVNFLSLLWRISKHINTTSFEIFGFSLFKNISLPHYTFIANNFYHNNGK